ncbi:MAG TPA: hypothetical protein VIZ68_06600 [Thermoplasmata archaeon]
MNRFRTIRARRHRARKGQVAAVGTVLALLLIVTFLANYLVEQLPLQLTAAEFEHNLQVGNQVSRLQATILAQATHPGTGMSLSAPVTLGSSAVPPFGPPSASSISPDLAAVKSSASYSVGERFKAEPNWGAGSACLTGGAGTCVTANAVNSWNITNSNGTTRTITISAAATKNSLVYNITGNNDTINIAWSGVDTRAVTFIINGSDNIVNYNKPASDTTLAPNAQFLFYGQNDKFSFNPAGSTSTGGGMKLLVQFIGARSPVCPFGNLSNTDKIGTLTSGGSNLNLTVIWWNAVGYRSIPHAQTFPGGGAKNETIHWSNQTGILGCAFTKTFSTSYQVTYGSGILVRLFNRYLPQTDFAYDQGAVIERQLGGLPVMLSPPEFTINNIPSGFAAALTLVHVVGSLPTETGLTTAGVSTTILSATTFTVVNGAGSGFLTSSYFLNITTAYPKAWITYLNGFVGLVPGGVTCTSTVTFVAPFSCQNPSSGSVVTIVAPLLVQSLSVTSVVVAVSLD